MEYQRIEVITGTPRRRRYTAEQKAAAVIEAMTPGASIGEVARRHGVCRSLLFRWRQLARASAPSSPSFVPVMLEAPAPPHAPAISSVGAIEIVLVDGRSIRFDAGIEAAALRRVLDAVERR
jgi:transposase